MPHESLARRFRPAGFEQPEGSRHNYTKPRAELQEAFREWICYLPSERGIAWGTKMENLYTKAQEIIRSVEEISKWFRDNFSDYMPHDNGIFYIE